MWLAIAKLTVFVWLGGRNTHFDVYFSSADLYFIVETKMNVILHIYN